MRERRADILGREQKDSQSGYQSQSVKGSVAMSKQHCGSGWQSVPGIRKGIIPVLALLLALCLLLAFPGKSEAHAVLLRSDPASNAILHTPPKQVHLWFSEAINPTLSTAQVVTPENQPAAQQRVIFPAGKGSENRSA